MRSCSRSSPRRCTRENKKPPCARDIDKNQTECGETESGELSPFSVRCQTHPSRHTIGSERRTLAMTMAAAGAAWGWQLLHGSYAGLWLSGWAAPLRIAAVRSISSKSDQPRFRAIGLNCGPYPFVRSVGRSSTIEVLAAWLSISRNLTYLI